jgi:hypothetical protein
MTTPRPLSPLRILLLGATCLDPGACASAGPVIPDTTERVPPPEAREGANPDDVFMRKPWELWRVPGGTARYHREAFMLLPNQSGSFKAGEVSIYAADGSDIRIDYVSVDLGENSQSHETISVFVYRAPGSLDSEWSAVAARMKRQHAGAKPTDAFPLPAKHPADTRQMALIAPNPGADKMGDTFEQVSLFHEGGWAVRYEITCPLADVAVARNITRTFLGEIRARE